MYRYVKEHVTRIGDKLGIFGSPVRLVLEVFITDLTYLILT